MKDAPRITVSGDDETVWLKCEDCEEYFFESKDSRRSVYDRTRCDLSVLSAAADQHAATCKGA